MIESGEDNLVWTVEEMKQKKFRSSSTKGGLIGEYPRGQGCQVTHALASLARPTVGVAWRTWRRRWSGGLQGGCVAVEHIWPARVL